jgi:hypothetical protein
MRKLTCLRQVLERERTQGSETSHYLEEKKAINGTFFLVGSVERLAITIRKKVLAIP